MIELIVYAVIIGFVIAIVVLVVQFTVANISAIFACSAVAAVLYYFLLKPNNANPSTRAPRPVAPAKPQEPPKPMSKSWSWAWGILLWMVFWGFLLMTISLYFPAMAKWPIGLKVLYFLSPHIIAILRIAHKRLKGKNAKNKVAELKKMLRVGVKILVNILTIVAIASGVFWVFSIIAN